jgi:hypothetical protein
MSSRVDELTDMSRDIYQWFSRNLKDRELVEDESCQALAYPEPDSKASSDLTFSLHLGPQDGKDIAALCERACFNPDWLQNCNEHDSPPIFQCQCRSLQRRHGSIHDCEVASYSCMAVPSLPKTMTAERVSIPCKLNSSLKWNIQFVDDLALFATSVEPCFISPERHTSLS